VTDIDKKIDEWTNAAVATADRIAEDIGSATGKVDALVEQVSQEFDRLGGVFTEIDLRLSNADDEGDILDARVAGEALRQRVREVLADKGLSMEDYRQLAGLVGTPSENPTGRWRVMGADFSQSEVFDLMRKMERNVYKPLIPIKVPDKPKDAIKLLESVRMDMKYGSAAGMSVATTEVSTGDPYRTAGKRTIEEVLKEQGIGFDIFIKIRVTDNPEHLERNQRELLERLDEAHPRIKFLYEFEQGPVALVLSYPKKPGFFRRIWTSICVRFGMEAAGIKYR